MGANCVCEPFYFCRSRRKLFRWKRLRPRFLRLSCRTLPRAILKRLISVEFRNLCRHLISCVGKSVQPLRWAERYVGGWVWRVSVSQAEKGLVDVFREWIPNSFSSGDSSSEFGSSLSAMVTVFPPEAACSTASWRVLSRLGPFCTTSCRILRARSRRISLPIRLNT